MVFRLWSVSTALRLLIDEVAFGHEVAAPCFIHLRQKEQRPRPGFIEFFENAFHLHLRRRTYFTALLTLSRRNRIHPVKEPVYVVAVIIEFTHSFPLNFDESFVCCLGSLHAI